MKTIPKLLIALYHYGNGVTTLIQNQPSVIILRQKQHVNAFHANRLREASRDLYLQPTSSSTTAWRATTAKNECVIGSSNNSSVSWSSPPRKCSLRIVCPASITVEYYIYNRKVLQVYNISMLLSKVNSFLCIKKYFQRLVTICKMHESHKTKHGCKHVNVHIHRHTHAYTHIHT